jgi:hypothetical protein
MSEPEFDKEMAEALENAEGAEVVCIIMPTLNQCLVYDSRYADGDPPRISVSAPLGSAERRLRHVNRARPDLKHAREMAALPWTGSIISFEDSKIWRLLYNRMTGAGFDGAESQCEDVLHELRQWERRTLITMIKGQGPYHTIWSRVADKA